MDREFRLRRRPCNTSRNCVLQGCPTASHSTVSVKQIYPLSSHSEFPGPRSRREPVPLRLTLAGRIPGNRPPSILRPPDRRTWGYWQNPAKGSSDATPSLRIVLVAHVAGGGQESCLVARCAARESAQQGNRVCEELTVEPHGVVVDTCCCGASVFVVAAPDNLAVRSGRKIAPRRPDPLSGCVVDIQCPMSRFLHAVSRSG